MRTQELSGDSSITDALETLCLLHISRGAELVNQSKASFKSAQ
jgi:hypothetical protein